MAEFTSKKLVSSSSSSSGGTYMENRVSAAVRTDNVLPHSHSPTMNSSYNTCIIDASNYVLQYIVKGHELYQDFVTFARSSPTKTLWVSIALLFMAFLFAFILHRKIRLFVEKK